MNRTEIENAIALATDADTDHEDARDWYDSYGWHLSTDAGDVSLQAVDYDWLTPDARDEYVDSEGCCRQCGHPANNSSGCGTCDSPAHTDDVALTLLLLDYDLSDDEASAIVEMARSVREAAESICGLLDDAVEAYQRGDLDACRAALLAAYSQELEHGDAPATQTLAGELLTDTVIRYRVYEAADGCDPVFCGEFGELSDAQQAAADEPGGLPRSLWGTAQAAGHCGGMSAPDGGDEDEEPVSWHGESGWHCVVRVTYRSRT